MKSLNEDVLKPSIVDSLCNAVPQDAESGCWPKSIDLSTLQNPDLFCIEVLTVKGYEARFIIFRICRVNALRFKNGYKELADDLARKSGLFI
jgi:hypothetical protein